MSPGKQDRFRKSRPCARCNHSKRAHAKFDLFGWFIGLGPCREAPPGHCDAYV